MTPNALQSSTPRRWSPTRRRSDLRVAAVQLRSTDDLESNAGRIRESLAACARQRVQVAAFPECAVTGYTTEAILRPKPSELLRVERELAEDCRRHRIHALIGIPWHSRGRIHNSVLVFDARGKLVARHLKIHLVGQDHAWDCTPGSAPSPVFSIGRAPCALFICHDSRYPELARLPVLAGARVLFYLSHEASLKKEWKMAPYRAQVQARAAENTVFIVHANAPANPDLTGSHGQSRMVDPGGNILAEASQFDEEILVADLHLPDATAENALHSLDHPPLGDWWRDGLRHIRVLD